MRRLVDWRFKNILAALAIGVLSAAWLSKPALAQEPDRVTVGMFVASVFDLDFYAGTFETLVWVWFIHDDEDFDPVNGIEITNAREYEVMEQYGYRLDDGRYYEAAKLSAIINQPWDVSNFPFDTQNLEIVLESVGKDAAQLVFDVDRKNSVNGPELALSGWTLLPIQAETQVFQYNTNFGDGSAAFASFPRVKFTIPLERSNSKLFLEAFIGYLIAFLMCGAIWITSAYNMADYRIGLILGATFAAIGNKNVLETNYPPSPHFGLEDQIEVSTFLLITLSLLITVTAERLYLSGRGTLARRLNVYGPPVVLISYMIAFISFVLVARA